jgi:hypothetical protein
MIATHRHLHAALLRSFRVRRNPTRPDVKAKNVGDAATVSRFVLLGIPLRFNLLEIEPPDATSQMAAS